MKIILAFLPLIAFLVAQRVIGPDSALIAAATVALGMTLTNIIIRRVGVKMLDLGSTVLFCGIAAYVHFSAMHLTLAQIRLCVDSGLLLIVLISVLTGRPFTLQYSPNSAPHDLRILHAHKVISAMWVAAFAAMAAVDILWILHPGLPTGSMVAASAVITVLTWLASRRYIAGIKADSAESSSR